MADRSKRDRFRSTSLSGSPEFSTSTSHCSPSTYGSWRMLHILCSWFCSMSRVLALLGMPSWALQVDSDKRGSHYSPTRKFFCFPAARCFASYRPLLEVPYIPGLRLLGCFHLALPLNPANRAGPIPMNRLFPMKSGKWHAWARSELPLFFPPFRLERSRLSWP